MDIKQTVPVINQIEEGLKDIPGWSPVDQLYTLFTLTSTTAGLQGDILEIGSWCGRSAVVLGTAAKFIGCGRVHCVDLFPEKNDWHQNAEGKWWFEVNLGDKNIAAYKSCYMWDEAYRRDVEPLYRSHNGILDIFNENIRRHELSDIVRPFRGDTSQFGRSLPKDFQCRLAFVDGDHGYDEVCQDIEIVEKHLVAGGWICFDDAFTVYDGVSRAIEDRVIKNPAFELAQQMTRKCFIARRKK